MASSLPAPAACLCRIFVKLRDFDVLGVQLVGTRPLPHMAPQKVRAACVGRTTVISRHAAHYICAECRGYRLQ
jgi:hypothetical protein